MLTVFVKFTMTSFWGPKRPQKALHSSPKEMQLFWSCLSFGEECRSVNFGPNINCTLLLVTIRQKPHSKIPHHSRTVGGHLSTSYTCNFTTLPKCNIKKKYGICISCNEISAISWKAWEDVYSDYWVYWQNRLIFFNGVFCLLLPGAFPLVHMTRGHWPWFRVTMKNLEI